VGIIPTVTPIEKSDKIVAEVTANINTIHDLNITNITNSNTEDYYVEEEPPPMKKYFTTSGLLRIDRNYYRSSEFCIKRYLFTFIALQINNHTGALVSKYPHKAKNIHILNYVDKTVFKIRSIGYWIACQNIKKS